MWQKVRCYKCGGIGHIARDHLGKKQKIEKKIELEKKEKIDKKREIELREQEERVEIREKEI